MFVVRKSRQYIFARVVELADALASGASVREDVWVQLPPRAPETAWFPRPFFFLLLGQTPADHEKNNLDRTHQKSESGLIFICSSQTEQPRAS